ncbi:MAG: PIG-L family deacetylase [Eubacteriales bacterium]|nr:PIG-L family deacetylase [Eubacteriales bacterium]
MYIYIPDGTESAVALKRTTHLAIAAHEDDLELNIFPPIAMCCGEADLYFTGVVATDGAGCPRAGAFADVTDEEMVRIRRAEQIKAADIGRYNAQVFLDFTSAQIKAPGNAAAIDAIARIIEDAKPAHIFTHNLADKHPTHVGTAVKTVQALRALKYKPETFCGCEGWRDLDWLNDELKMRFDVSKAAELGEKLVAVFESQIAGGKRYDRASVGRRVANATFAESHAVDTAQALCVGMDLMPLLLDPALDIEEFICQKALLFVDELHRTISSVK